MQISLIKRPTKPQAELSTKTPQTMTAISDSGMIFPLRRVKYAWMPKTTTIMLDVKMMQPKKVGSLCWHNQPQ